jgi:3-deoxy-D-arabino-heptulosonate 7-phosphate (DAHP) synthase
VPGESETDQQDFSGSPEESFRIDEGLRTAARQLLIEINRLGCRRAANWI